MKVNFDLVRLGKISHNNVSEKALKQDVQALKESIRLFLENFNLNDRIDIIVVVPSESYDVKFYIDRISDASIKEELRLNFSESIYKGGYSKIMMNLKNPIFSRLLK